VPFWQLFKHGRNDFLMVCGVCYLIEEAFEAWLFTSAQLSVGVRKNRPSLQDIINRHEGLKIAVQSICSGWIFG